MDFYQEKQNDGIKRLNPLIKELPPFAKEFFVGIAERTSVLTRLNYAYDLRIFFDFLGREILFKNARAVTLDDLNALTVTDIEAYVHYVDCYEFRDNENSNGERGKARKLSSARSFFKYYFNKNKLKANVAAKVTLPKLHDKEIVRLDTDEIARLLDGVESGDGLTKKQKDYHARYYKRDLAMLTLFLGTGIRISECVGLNIDDIDFRNNAFKVTRKGGNQAILYFSDEVADALLEYLDERTENENGSGNTNKNKSKNEKENDASEIENALFLSSQKRRISARAVENLVKKYSRIIAPLKKITPHKLRSTYGTALYRETNDIYVVAEVLGHRDINTTKKHYAAMSDDIRRGAASKVRLRDNDE
ncbi:MAG: tyrosine-type recombinase/integrase [Clostridiales bacterium]|jgi:site-specific recombinase XerD|nr:tyrosine-type recombinase/integrase [Clostridiales bacterium]